MSVKMHMVSCRHSVLHDGVQIACSAVYALCIIGYMPTQARLSTSYCAGQGLNRGSRAHQVAPDEQSLPLKSLGSLHVTVVTSV